ncbi:MAG: 3-oxoacyl-ACP reductase FabG [Clostridiales bacterium]|nr:3-oxoacyl-ACP reductase FabG [Clostridiales bacterium]
MKTALITGGARGIGAATATAFARAGYAVGIHYLNSCAEAAALVGRLSAEGLVAEAFCADLADPGQAAAMVAEAEAGLGSLEVLVNNAGRPLYGLFPDLDMAEWDRLWHINVGGAIACSRAALPGMIARGRGCILNISSIWGLCGASCEVAYSTTKAALIGFTRALAKEVGPAGVRVNCIAPGMIDTAMLDGLSQGDREDFVRRTPLGRLGRPEDVAAAALWLAGPDAGFLTGQVLGVEGGVL